MPPAQAADHIRGPFRRSAGTGLSVRAPVDPLGRFYSVEHVGRIVAEAASCPSPTSVLDLAAGAGILAASASARWPAASVLAVDIDETACAAAASAGLAVLAADCLCTASPVEAGTRDLVVSNPPYVTRPWTPVLASVLAEADLIPDDCPPGGAPLEALFAARALAAARPGGSIVLVVSDGFATGRRWARFRRRLAERNRIDVVVQLDAGSFQGTKARAFVLSMTKGVHQDRPVVLWRAGSAAELRIDAPVFVDRLDHDFHAVAARSGPTLRDLGAHLVRGSFETAGSMPEGSLFHTTRFPAGPERFAMTLPELPFPEIAPRAVRVGPGDVLVGRLGRGIERKVCLIAGGSAYPTSAVFRIRAEPAVAAAIAQALLSDEGQRRLAATARGTAARMLGSRDLFEMPLPMAAGYRLESVPA